MNEVVDQAIDTGRIVPDIRDKPERFINRELSWLDFNTRVLQEAENERHPLFERVRFLSISASNLDEFYSVRVAGLADQAREGVITTSADGRTSVQQLNEIRKRAEVLLADQQRVWNELRSLLDGDGVKICDLSSLSDADTVWLDTWFMERVFPVLTPLAIDPAHPFPFISNMGLVVALDLRREESERPMHALLPLPAQVERFIRLPALDDGGALRFLMLDDLVRLFLDRVFPAFHVAGQGLFRVIRDTDVEFEEEAEDLVLSYETALKRRRRGVAIHLSMDAQMPQGLQTIIASEIDAESDQIYLQRGLQGMADLKQLMIDDRPDLLFPRYKPRFLNAFVTSAATALQQSDPRTSSFIIHLSASTS
jgi:polyphosphate kinase